MNRLVLALLTSPSLFLSLLMLPAGATPMAPVLDLSIVKTRTLPVTQDPVVNLGSSDNPEHPMLNFTVEESEAAAALFGCDCPYHLNALRSLRGLPPIEESAL